MSMELAKKKEDRRVSSVSVMVRIALMAAVICILGPLSIPIGLVPISLTNLAVYFAIYLLGVKNGTISYLIYMLLGLCGVPVFSGFTGGPAKLFGVTGGYIFGFIFMAIISGIFIEKFSNNRVLHFVGMILGTAVCYIFGTAWFIILTKNGVMASLSLCVFPFIPGDLIKMVLVICLGFEIKKRI